MENTIKNNTFEWRNRYLLCLKEYLTIKDIMVIRKTSTTVAIEIRKQAIDYLLEQDSNYIPPKTKVPTEAVLAVTGHDQEYYYKKMQDERKANY